VTAETGELAAGPAAALAHGRRGLITGLLVNLTRHYSKLFSARWTSIRHWAWLSLAFRA
jgi:hypothetical protein